MKPMNDAKGLTMGVTPPMTGKTVLITGGAGGFGRAAAIGLPPWAPGWASPAATGPGPSGPPDRVEQLRPGEDAPGLGAFGGAVRLPAE